jgi:hypothetical protein
VEEQPGGVSWIARNNLSRTERALSLKDVKITDDYHAKIRLWAQNPRVVPLPQGPALPKFRAQKFSSHQEMNEWKRQLLAQMARESGLNG